MLSVALRILATPALGGAAGFFGGVFGVGGGAIAIPLLGLLYYLDQQTAQGTTLVMVVPMCCSASGDTGGRSGSIYASPAPWPFQLWRLLIRPLASPPHSTPAVCVWHSQRFW